MNLMFSKFHFGLKTFIERENKIVRIFSSFTKAFKT